MHAGMTPMLGEEARDDLLSRGYSRRDLFRIAAVFSVSTAAATAGRPAWASVPKEEPPPPDLIHIGSNECWTGPFAPGQQAAARIICSTNRYNPGTQRDDFLKAVTAVEKVPADHVAPFPGSSDPLSRAVVTFCSPTRGLVTANPTYEQAWRTAEWLGAPLKMVPLKADYSHDVKAMLAANPDAGLFYVCSPNNPTGTLTPIADIEWLVANKPAGSMVMVDEAYIHFAGTPTASHLVAADKDVILLRTFSKVFGMAGMRMGYVMARPDILQKMMRYDGGSQSGMLPMPSLACATASLVEADLITRRRAQMQEARATACAHMKRRGVKFIDSEANMFMLDWRQPAGPMLAAMKAQGVEIGRSWPVWPTMSRITVGSMTEMEGFCAALDKVRA